MDQLGTEIVIAHGQYELTEEGSRVCSQTLELFPGNNYTQVLEFFDGLRGSSKRFVEKAPKWADVAPDMMMAEPATDHLVSLMREIHAYREGDPEEGMPLSDLVTELWTQDPEFVVRVFLRDDDRIIEAVVGSTDPSLWESDLDALNTDAIVDGVVAIDGEKRPIYRDQTVFQWKTLLYHMGVLTTTGREAAAIDPTENRWGLEPALRGDE